MIHHTHTKRDLIDLIDLFEIDVDTCNCKKDAIVRDLEITLKTMTEIECQPDYFDIEDLDDLVLYLEEPTPRQILTLPQKDIIMDKARNIIFFCKICGYAIYTSNYDDFDEIMRDAEEIRKYGDIPTIRRALRLLKKDARCAPYGDISPVLTYKTKKYLEKQKGRKITDLGGLKVKQATKDKPIVLVF